jgi:NAD(P)-dependent dehydrogenase (short-subunit alcohol dehydrogenase family)
MNKTILITGATGALSSATAVEIARSGATVVLLARNKQKLYSVKNQIVEKTGNKNVEILIADFTDIESVKNAAQEFKKKHKSLDALLNVAAVYKKNRKSKDGLETMFVTNHLAPFVLTNELLNPLKGAERSRIITVSAPSTTKINFDDLQGKAKFSSLNAFGSSKMMNLLFTYALAERLKNTNVSSAAFFPGLMKSDLMHELSAPFRSIVRLIARKPERAAKMLSELALDPAFNKSNGKFFKYNGKEIKSSPYSYDSIIQRKLWVESEKLAKTIATKKMEEKKILSKAYA